MMNDEHEPLVIHRPFIIHHSSFIVLAKQATAEHAVDFRAVADYQRHRARMKNDRPVSAIFLPAFWIDGGLNQVDDRVDILHNLNGLNAGISEADRVQSARIDYVPNVIGSRDHRLAP